jgi:general nucleoside transport system ATP-binding protein
VLTLRGITKRFADNLALVGDNLAVDDVTLELRGGEILALAGENGAGKTTLMRIAAGELAPSTGTIERAGEVGFVHQHFLLVSDFTIAENLALQRAWSFASLRKLEDEAEAIIAATGIELHGPSRRVEELSVGEKSKLELIKAIAKKPRVLILDEPTSVLTPTESAELFAVMRRVASEGTAVVFISHKLPEVLEIADRIVVMRRGRVVLETKSTTAQELAEAMTNRPSPAAAGEGGPERSEGPGEGILAIVGVAGNGQSQLAERFRQDHPDAGLIPEDRTRDGIITEMSIAENLALRSKTNTDALIKLFSIKATSAHQKAGSLSGGNQQKVILARELSRKPRMILAAEPTRGLDIEATAFVHAQLRAAADDGASILLITSDLDEAFALADEIQVIYRGKLSERMPPAVARERVGALMAGIG